MANINTVKMTRKIRDDIYRQTKTMTRKELAAYYHGEAKKLHKKLRVQSKATMNS